MGLRPMELPGPTAEEQGCEALGGRQTAGGGTLGWGQEACVCAFVVREAEGKVGQGWGFA